MQCTLSPYTFTFFSSIDTMASLLNKQAVSSRTAFGQSAPSRAAVPKRGSLQVWIVSNAASLQQAGRCFRPACLLE